MKYRCIVVDPPWDQKKTGKRKVRPNQGTQLDYSTMTLNEIASSVPVRSEWAADNSFIWIWATNGKSQSSGLSIIEQAHELMRRWDYKYYTMITWNKGTGSCPFGPYQIITEHCLFGYKGKAAFPKASWGKMQTVFEAPPTRHSEKPSWFYEAIAYHFPGPRLDVFARRRHKGFDAWGDEVEGGRSNEE